MDKKGYTIYFIIMNIFKTWLQSCIQYEETNIFLVSIYEVLNVHLSVWQVMRLYYCTIPYSIS